MKTAQSALTLEEKQKRARLKAYKPRVLDKILKYNEKIERGESIAILQFQYDYSCNFNCRHCCITRLRKSGNRSFFTLDDVRELSRQADEMGLAHIVITGGEPLLFPDLDELVEAIDPDKFYITSDTNGWFLDKHKARHLKSIGVDKIQLSLDSLSATEHDTFRRKPGSHARALKAIDASLEAGLDIILATVVTKQRVRSQEFLDFLEFAQKKGVGVFVTYAKPVGAWEGNFDVLITREDMQYVQNLRKKYNVFSHLTPAYGLDLGCIAVKRMVSITKYGDIMPCPYIHTSLGNFFSEPLKSIIDKGLHIRFFGQYIGTCLIAEDLDFIKNYELKSIYGKPLPVPYYEVFSSEDFIDEPQKPLCRPSAKTTL